MQDSYVGTPGVSRQYAAWNAGASTIVKVRQPGAGPAVSTLRLVGHWGIPGVDYSGATTGLSADGRTLILAQIPGSFPPRATRLLVLDTPRLAGRAGITLPGFSTVDAISPDGRWLYLIHYRSSNFSQYEVLDYDLLAHRVLASGRRAVCIDLPSLGTANVGNAQLSLGPSGTTLNVDVDGVTSTRIDTRTFKVSTGGAQLAAASGRPVAQARRAARGRQDAAWEYIVLVLGGLAVIAPATQLVRSRRHSAYRHRPEKATITVVDPRVTDRVPADDELP